MSGGAGGAPGGEELLTVTVLRDEHGYGMKVSGDNPVYVQSVKEHGAAWRAGLRAGDRILRVDGVPVHRHTHQQVVLMIRANPSTVLTVHQNVQRLKTPITAPLPVNSEKQRQLELTKANTFRLMLEQEQKQLTELRHELSKVPDVRKQAQLESSEKRCAKLQREIEALAAAQPDTQPSTPKSNRWKPDKTGSPPPNTGFLSGLPRSLSNLTGQSLRNLRARKQENVPPNQPIIRQSSEESNHKRRHNNTVPMVPTTCLDNVTPPPLPPRTRPMNPLAKPSGYYGPKSPMHQSMPVPTREERQGLRRSSHSLDGELDGPQPNSIAMQMSYPLVNAPPPPLQMDNRPPILHARSQSSPEHLDHGLTRPVDAWQSPPPPGTPPPPYAHNTQPCADPQRAIISMEEDDSPTSENSSHSGLFSNLRAVRDSPARTAVLLNWLLGERRCACACLLLILTDAYRAAAAPVATLRRWAYELHSTFLMPQAVLQLSGVDENMANEIEHVLSNEYEKEELLRNVFRKARQRAKEELAQQLSEFQVKRQVGLATLYGPADPVLDKCDADKAQEQIVVERVMSARLSALSADSGGGAAGSDILLAALAAAALALHCRPATVAAAAGGGRASFLQRDKLYKQRLKQLAKQHAQPFVVRGHHLQLRALTALAHCHACDLPLAGLAPQAAVCGDCKLRVHRACARLVEEPCCLDPADQPHKRMSRFMERIQGQDSSEKKSRKTSGTANFLNMERSFRKMEDEPSWENSPTNHSQERRDESDESLYESADGHSDAISASDDALPRLGKTPTMSKESLKLAITDEEVDVAKVKKGHRKAMSLSNPLDMVKSIDWLDAVKRDHKSDIKKSRESLWSEEERDFIGGSTAKIDQTRKNSKKDDKSLNGSRKESSDEQPKVRKISKGSSVSALSLFRRKKAPMTVKTVEVVDEGLDRLISTDEILQSTKFFLEEEKRHSSNCEAKPIVETDSDDEDFTPPKPSEHRRRLSRQTSRSKSKARGKSQSVKVNTLRKSHSGTLKKTKKKGVKTPIVARSRQTSIAVATPLLKKKKSDSTKQTAWLFSTVKGEARREGSSDEPQPAEADVDLSDAKDQPDKDNNWRSAPSGGRGVNRAESCRERDAPRRGKHRNASDPNRLTAHNHHDLEPGAAAPSGSSSSSSISSRSTESNTVPQDHQASTSDWSDEEEPLAAAWADSVPQHIRDELLPAKLRKRQEIIHELILSEGSHVRWLKVLGVMFLRPLEAAPALLPPDELRALFPNLPQVRERHARLYAELRALRHADRHVVSVGAVADVMLNTLGDAGYAGCLARFCRGQRMALEALRERRRKHKELHAFLAAREQHPRCTRLQLRDLLACVWQRLTKYQLLLESLQATGDLEEDAPRLQAALRVAKDVLHQVDTAVRTAENQHRLRTIQSKLEVRASGAEWDELRRLDLTGRALRTEGDLAIRNDTNKKTQVLGLMLEDMLVLLQREGDKFVLKPITQPSQQAMLSPVIRWDTVLFRPNAAVRNTFFLMNINGVQMHELSTHTGAEYATWVRYIQEAPLAKLTELKPLPHAPRSNDDSGINVSRNPSDASEKSSSTAPAEEEPIAAECEPSAPEAARAEPSAPELARAEPSAPEEPEETERDDRSSEERTIHAEEERHVAARGSVRDVTREARGALTVLEPVAATHVQRAATVLQHDERLRRLDAVVAAALRAKSVCVAELLGASPRALPLLADMAVAETLGQVDEVPGPEDSERQDGVEDAPHLHQLLLAAYAQATQLTEILSRALSEPAPLAAPAAGGSGSSGSSSGQCGACRRRREPQRANSSDEASSPLPPAPPAAPPRLEAALLAAAGLPGALAAGLGPAADQLADAAEPADSADSSYDLLPELRPAAAPRDQFEGAPGAAALARALLSPAGGLQRALSRVLCALPPAAERALRGRLLAAKEAAAAARHRRRLHDYQMMEDETYLQEESVDQTITDQPSNGG